VIYIYIYIYGERERERERESSHEATVVYLVRTLAATIFDVRTSFPLERSWYVSPELPAAIVIEVCDVYYG
jgi:hypothetical protein